MRLHLEVLRTHIGVTPSGSNYMATHRKGGTYQQLPPSSYFANAEANEAGARWDSGFSDWRLHDLRRTL
jgi:hypothetical protein